jgi:peptidoglycan/xylan/chitin deacetylase (PgdA/CDA1 family)
LSLFEPLARVLGGVTSPRGDAAKLTVLLYHRVLPRPDPLVPHEPDAAEFDAQLACLARVFRVVSLEDGLRKLREGTLPARAICITFDDGYRDNIEVAVPVLKRHGLTASFFIATGFLDGGRMMHDTVIEAVRRLPDGACDLGWIGLGQPLIGDAASRVALIDEFVRCVKYLPFQERADACLRLAQGVKEPLPTDLMMVSDHVRQLVSQGMEVGAHTHNHPILARLSPEEAAAQIVKSRDTLADLLGSTPTLFAYPNGKPNLDYGSEHVDLVKQAGFSAAVSVSMGTASRTSDHFQIPRFIPWDRDPRRLALRILAHPHRHSDTDLAN